MAKRSRSAAKGGGGRTPAEAARRLAIDAARLMGDDKCEGVVVLDVREISQVTDYLVIGSGTSERQMRSVLQHVVDLGEQTGHRVFRHDIDARATWGVADFVDVVVHVFEPNTRGHYDLEMLWGDGKKVRWERRGAAQDRAGLVRGEGRAARGS